MTLQHEEEMSQLTNNVDTKRKAYVTEISELKAQLNGRRVDFEELKVNSS
jgi:hypothetical protein